MQFYRTTLLICVTAWFLLGLHAPALHEITDHGAQASASLMIGVGVLVVAGIGGLWLLLRRSGPGHVVGNQ